MDLAKEAIERASQVNPQDRPFLESAFTNYISAVAYAEIESRVASLLDARFAQCADQKVGTFVSNVFVKKQGRLKKSDMADVAQMFGDQCKVVFNAAIDNAQASHYSNLLECRHKLSHGEPASETLLTVENGIAAAEVMLQALSASVQ
ncbi:MAG: hypothetical protein K2W77_13525 [Tabrizicola sp.]|jgi:hypothetical protein|nr:hypothetical protein [Tabrizicola sp.]